MGLRPYQKDCIRSSIADFKAGIHQQLWVLPTGCHRVGQGILMYDGSISPVENIRVGDLLIGPDSTPRSVRNLCRGVGQMVSIDPIRGQPFVVNEDHILTLKRTRETVDARYPCDLRGGELLDISVKELRSTSKWHRHLHKLFRVGVDFPEQGSLPIPPYSLGVILGDGCMSGGSVTVCKPDPEIPKALHEELSGQFGVTINPHSTASGKAPVYSISRVDRGKPNQVVIVLKSLGLMGLGSERRFIPSPYKTASRSDRLQILAGLMDTDGHWSGHGTYDYISMSQHLAEDVTFVARSLGLAAFLTPCVKSCQTGASGNYFRVCISGNCDMIPCRIPRKKATPRLQKKDPLCTGFSIKSLGEEAYYGFELDGDGRYLLDDFTVTHNSGKTRCAAHIPKLMAQPREQTLFVVHRDELIWQAAEAFREINPTMSIGIEKAEFSTAPDTDIIVASIQTLGRVGSTGLTARLLKFKPERIRFVILDEAHRATANAWRPLLEHLRVYRQASPDPRKLLVGITATPERTDGIGLDLLFEKISYEIPMRRLMETGVDVDGALYPYLAPIQAHRVTTEVDLSAARSKGGDFLEKDLAHALDTPERNRLVVRKYQELGDGLPALCFSVNVAHAHNMVEEFIANGITAAVVSGETPRNERLRIYEAFDGGGVRVIASCDAITEGFDRPRATVALLARPTKSSLLYRQQLGRVLRPFPAPEAYQEMRSRGARPEWVKRAAIVLDFCDLTGRHQINTVPTLFGLRPDFDMKGDSVVEVMEEVEKIAAKNPGLDLKQARSIEDVKSQVDRIDLFRAPEIRSDVKKLSKFAWLEIFDGVLQMQVAGGVLEVRQNTLGKFELWQCRDGLRALRDTQASLAGALTVGDSMVPKDQEILLKSKARWRKDPPTENQCRKLHHTDPSIKGKFSNGLEFYRFAFKQFHQGNQNYSKGGVSAMIHRHAMQGKAEVKA